MSNQCKPERWLRRLQRDEVECTWAFLSTEMTFWTELSWKALSYSGEKGGCGHHWRTNEQQLQAVACFIPDMGNQDVLCISDKVTGVFCEFSQTGYHNVLSNFDKVIKIHREFNHTGDRDVHFSLPVTKIYCAFPWPVTKMYCVCPETGNQGVLCCTAQSSVSALCCGSHVGCAAE